MEVMKILKKIVWILSKSKPNPSQTHDFVFKSDAATVVCGHRNQQFQKACNILFEFFNLSKLISGILYLI